MAPIHHTTFPFLLLPREIRSMIYEYLLPPSFDNDILIETWEAPSILTKCPPTGLLRTTYSTYNRKSFHAPAYLTTYRPARIHCDDDERMYPEIMAVNRQINYETSQLLYGDRCFHFKHHLNALIAFFGDMRSSTMALIQRVSLDLTLPGSPSTSKHDNSEFWPNTAQALRRLPHLRGLAITLTGSGAPLGTDLATPPGWQREPQTERPTPKPTVDIFHYLCYTGNESICWMLELFPLESSLEHLVIVPRIEPVQRLASAKISGRMHSYAQISAHMDTTMIDYLRDQGLPARVMTEKERRPRIVGCDLGVPRISIRPIDF